MDNIKLDEIRYNMLSEEIAINMLKQITPSEYIKLSYSAIDPTLTIKRKKLKIKNLGIKNILGHEIGQPTN